LKPLVSIQGWVWPGALAVARAKKAMVDMTLKHGFEEKIEPFILTSLEFKNQIRFLRLIS
jgi:hypothetical protein